MPRIKIKNLPDKGKISREELRRVMGGTFFVSPYPFYGLRSNSTALGAETKVLESQMEELRNKRQETMTAFDNFDSKSSDS